MGAPWPGFSEGGGLLLPLDHDAHLLPVMPSRLALDGHALERKDELHLTLLDRTQGTTVRGRLGDTRVRALFESQDWVPAGTGRHALLHREKHARGHTAKPEAWSVVELLQEPALAAFRRALARATGLDLDDGVPHVTLYVAGDPGGIGVPDAATWRARFVRDVATPELFAAT